MNTSEFRRFCVSLQAALPDTWRWANELPLSRQTLEGWEHSLRDVNLDDAQQVLAMMARGDLDPIAAYDRERLPAIVRKHANDLKSKRVSRLPTKAETWRDGVKCRTCGDTGFASVWSAAAMQTVLAGESLDGIPQSYRRCMMRCRCERGFPRGTLLSELQKGQERPRFVETTPRLGEVVAVECPHGDVTSVAAIEAFTKAMEQIANRQDERGNEFTDWNQQ